MKTLTALDTLIYKNYLKSSLLPIFAIEIVLLILYFGVSYFITQKSQELLYQEASQNLLEITKREAQNINEQLSEVSRLSKIMQKDHEYFFMHPENCFLPNAKPSFARHSNGAYYKTLDNGGSSLYYTAATTLGDAQLKKSLCSEAIDPLLKNIVNTHPLITQAYLNTHDSLNRLYPFMEDAPKQYGAYLDVKAYNFYYLADKAHNPSRSNQWTNAYLDPAGQGWMISNIVPIYNRDFLEGVSGVDVTIDAFVKNTLALDIPWDGSAFMVDSKGMILAMPEKIEEIFQLKELKEHTYTDNIAATIEKPQEYNLLSISDALVKKSIKKLLQTEQHLIELTINDQEYLIGSYKIAQTGWNFMVLLNKSHLFAPIQKLKNQIDTLGYVVILMMVFFYFIFFLYLLKKSKKLAFQIADPIAELSMFTDDLGRIKESLITTKSGIYEVDQLTKNFNRLSKELDARTEAYVQAQLREKMMEKDAEIAYRAGLFESASSYLHNIGNAITVLNGKVRVMQTITQALQKTSLGFEKVRSMVHNSNASEAQKEALTIYLNDFDKALSENIVSEVQTITGAIQDTTSYATESIRHQQNDFNDSNASLKKYIQRFNLKSLLESLIEDYRISCAAKGIRVSFHCPEEIEVASVKFQLHNGLSNIIKNAIESIQSSQNATHGQIDIRVTQDEKHVSIAISDNGLGVQEQHKTKMFTAGFTTKEDGHGLGLHAFNNFLNTGDSSISFSSQGAQQGATIVIKLRGVQK